MIPITRIHQIEITSRCNLRCRYCPSPHLGRPKLDMTRETWEATLGWVRYFHERNGGTQELNLAGIGESTMHPDFVAFVHEARAIVGWNCFLTFTTNGLLITEELAAALAPSRVAVGVSLHRPEKAGPAIEILKRHGLLWAVSADPSIAATDWAGQVKWHTSAQPGRKCPWVIGGRVFVMADGNVSRCCIDASGVGVFAHVTDDLTRFQTSPYSLCATCDQDVGLEMPKEAAA